MSAGDENTEHKNKQNVVKAVHEFASVRSNIEVHNHDDNPNRHRADHLIYRPFRQESDAQSETELSEGEDKLPPEVAWLVANPPFPVRVCVNAVLYVQSAMPKDDAVCDQVKANVPQRRKYGKRNKTRIVYFAAAADCRGGQHVGCAAGDVTAGQNFNYSDGEWHEHKIVKGQDSVNVRVHGLDQFFLSSQAYFFCVYLNALDCKPEQQSAKSALNLRRHILCRSEARSVSES